MLKMAMKLKARALESERKTALAAAEVAAEAAAVAAALAEQRASRKKGVAEKPPKKSEQEAPGEKLLTEKERRKMEKKLQPRLLCQARISFKYVGEIKSFTEKQKLREFSTTKPALEQMLNDLF